MRVSVIGLGKLGAPMAACLSAKGLRTIGVDLNESYVAAINEARPPVLEPNLAETLAAGRPYLTATTDTVAAVLETDATFIIVPTPSDSSGGFSLEYVIDACEEIGRAIAQKTEYHLVVLTSTVMPGSTEGQVLQTLESASGKQAGTDFGLCYSPEFIALGSVIRDFLYPDFLLIGESDERAGDMLTDIYGRVIENDAPIARLSFVNAELAKMSVNTFVTMKIAFANTLARLCEALPGGDIDQVTEALGLDTRIGKKYLRGAISYGGPCFPRDNRALAALARDLHAPALLAEATDTTNRDGIERLVQLVLDRMPEGATAGVLGLTYKPETDVVEESAGLHVARRLSERSVNVIAYDPLGMPNARHALNDREIRFAESGADCVAASDILVVATPWDEFRHLVMPGAGRDDTDLVVIDCWRIMQHLQAVKGVDYIALGEGPSPVARVALG
jgi:UDPglucose 6-dehydrogenase